MGKEWAGLLFPRGKNGPAHSFPGEKIDWGKFRPVTGGCNGQFFPQSVFSPGKEWAATSFTRHVAMCTALECGVPCSMPVKLGH